MFRSKSTIIIILLLSFAGSLHASAHSLKYTHSIDCIIAAPSEKQVINFYKKTSSYGEISPKTGRRKTVHVRGYRKKNGTYVKKHYRSPPRKSFKSTYRKSSYRKYSRRR